MAPVPGTEDQSSMSAFPRVRPSRRGGRRRTAVATATATLVLAPLAVIAAMPTGASAVTSAVAGSAVRAGSVDLPQTPTRLTTRWSATRVAAGRSINVSGVVTPHRERRTLQLQRKVLGRWVTSRQTKVTGAAYKMKVPTWWVGSFEYKVVVAATDDADATASSRRRVVVTPTYKPRGRASQHSFMGGPAPRWDPCSVIRYRVNTHEATKGALADTKEAIRRISVATGLRFKYVGSSARIPQGTAQENLGRDTDLLIAWAKPAQSRMFDRARGSAGVGGPLWWRGHLDGNGEAASLITRGKVVLNATQKYTAGFAEGRYTRGQLLMHELGHAVGLGHSKSKSEIMYPVMVPISLWGAGDLAGLAEVGASQGCFVHPGVTAGRVVQTPASVWGGALPLQDLSGD